MEESEYIKVKCQVCNKTVKFVDQSYCKCRCGQYFCPRHRYSGVSNSENSHKCSYDYITEGKKELCVQVQKVVSDKITNRV